MPVYAQAAFLPRALASLHAQDHTDWELVVIDDGSPEPVDVDGARLIRHVENRGLGAALNTGLDAAQGDVIAYLPADDVFHAHHLSTLLALLDRAALARTGEGPLQLVQVAHRRTGHRWVERAELESDDLERLFFARLQPRASDPAPTSTWTEHPGQRHRVLRPSQDGGLNTFRRRYRARGPLHLEAEGRLVADERRRYAPFAHHEPAPPKLRVLLAGELGYNPERILALETRGCDLSGLWIDDPLGFMAVGPLAFGNVTDVDDWRDAKPDVIYALLNWRAVPLAHRLLDNGVPLVFHFKEAPQRCLARGDWPLLVDVLARADTVILASPEERDWLLASLPQLDPARFHAMDGDLPKREWLDATPSTPTGDGLDTVLLGRPYGFDAALYEALAARGIRVHHEQTLQPHEWVSALSRYDAGWLHPVAPRNGGDPHAAAWDDLNLPARLPTLVAAGLPLIAPRGGQHEISAVGRLATELGCGVLYEDLDDLAAQLRDTTAMQGRGAAAWGARETQTFDHHADQLVRWLQAAAGRTP
ncbi:glycosyltransferase [Solirubrobacter sp. CPCC 204708]|nr:glycosyltransferase [Solirubrobacter deserti]